MTNIAAAAFGGSGSPGNYGTGDNSMDVNQAGGGASPAPGNAMLSAWSGTSSTLSSLGAAGTALSMLGTLGAANAKSDSLKLQASQDLINAQGATENGMAKVTGLRGALMNTIGQRNAITGAGGVDVGQGVAADTRTAITTANDYAAKSALTTADIQNRNFQIGALNNQLAAHQAQNAGVVTAIGQGLKFLTSFATLGA